MQVLVPKQKKSAFARNPGFFVNALIIGGFVSLVGYLGAVCHHVH